MTLYLTPDLLRPGDRIEGLSGDGPAVVSIGDAVHTDGIGDELPVTVEGEDRPRLLPVGTMISVLRDSPAEEATAEPADPPA